jgi:hypothetical protein
MQMFTLSLKIFAHLPHMLQWWHSGGLGRLQRLHQRHSNVMASFNTCSTKIAARLSGCVPDEQELICVITHTQACFRLQYVDSAGHGETKHDCCSNSKPSI